MSGWKNESELLMALREGSVQTAAGVLKRIHDTRRAYRELEMAKKVPAMGSMKKSTEDLAGLAFQVAQLQTEFAARLLGVSDAHASKVQSRVFEMLGMRKEARTDEPSLRVEPLRLEGPMSPFETRFRVKNAGGKDATLQLDKIEFMLTAEQGETIPASAALEPSGLEGGLLRAGRVSLVRLEVTTSVSLAATLPYRGSLRLLLEGVGVMRLDLEVVATEEPKKVLDL